MAVRKRVNMAARGQTSAISAHPFFLHDSSRVRLGAPGFTNADDEARSASINAVGHHVSDTSFRRGVDRLLNDPKFQALSAAEKVNAIKAYDQFASSSAYRGGMLTLHVEKQAKAAALDSLRTVVTAPGFHKMQPGTQQAAISALENNRPNEVADSIAQLSNSAGFHVKASALRELGLRDAVDREIFDAAPLSRHDFGSIPAKL